MCSSIAQSFEAPSDSCGLGPYSQLAIASSKLPSSGPTLALHLTGFTTSPHIVGGATTLFAGKFYNALMILQKSLEYTFKEAKKGHLKNKQPKIVRVRFSPSVTTSAAVFLLTLPVDYGRYV